MAFDDLFDDMVPQGTVRFTLDLIFVRSDKPLVLIMKHAGDSNPAYKSARTKFFSEMKAHTSRGADDALIAIIIKLFANTVITGWENVNEDDKPVPFSPARCIELLAVLARKAGDELDAAFAYARDPNNFRGSITAAADALGK